MADASVLQAVQHYQRSIEKNSSDVARLLHCVGKLYKMPITVDHLQQTGVGRTVNGLRKHGGELGVAAEAVVNKWKEIVAAENDRRANGESSSEDEQHDRNLDGNDDNNAQTSEQQQHEKSSVDRESKQASSTSTKSRSPSSHEHHNRHKNNEEKERSSDRDKHKKQSSKSVDASGSSSKDKKQQSDSSKHKRRKDEERNDEKTASRDEKERKEHKHKKHESSKKHHSSSSGKHKDKQDKQNGEHKRSHTKTESSKKHADKRLEISEDVTPPQASKPAESSSSSKRRHEESVSNDAAAKKVKTLKNNEAKREKATEADDDGIDSSMGANFADVLGMLNMPQKKAKKSLNTLKQQTSPSPSKKAENEPSKEKSSNSSTSTKLKSGRGGLDFDAPSTSSTSKMDLEKKPTLLSSNVKLAPLDPSIALELPVISNNYKPLPLNPTVMDCVFNSSTSSSSRAPPRLFSDAEALSHGISSKTIRTKVYSGVKTGQLFQVPSLFDLCIRVLQKNIDALEYTGGVPFDVLRPVLERASPQQLFTFEEYNPYLMEDSDVLWQMHVQRTYRGQKREEMESWREMFMRCQEEQERRLSMLAQNIKQSQKVMAEPVRKTQLAFVDSMVKPPRNVMRKQEQYGTKSKLVATPAARVAALSSVTPNAAKTGDVRLRTSAAIKFDPAQAAFTPARPKKAPLMAKTLQFIRGRQKR